MYIDTLMCPECGYRKESINPALSLSLDLTENIPCDQSVVKLNSMIRNFSAPEVLDESNRWNCSNCSKLVCATKSATIERLPDRLLLHLKRFRFNQVTVEFRLFQTLNVITF